MRAREFFYFFFSKSPPKKKRLRLPAIKLTPTHANVNAKRARAVQIALLLATMKMHPDSLYLSAESSGLKIIRKWLKESTFTTGGGSVTVLLHILRSIRGLHVTEQVSAFPKTRHLSKVVL